MTAFVAAERTHIKNDKDVNCSFQSLVNSVRIVCVDWYLNSDVRVH